MHSWVVLTTWLNKLNSHCAEICLLQNWNSLPTEHLPICLSSHSLETTFYFLFLRAQLSVYLLQASTWNFSATIGLFPFAQYPQFYLCYSILNSFPTKGFQRWTRWKTVDNIATGQESFHVLRLGRFYMYFLFWESFVWTWKSLFFQPCKWKSKWPWR